MTAIIELIIAVVELIRAQLEQSKKALMRLGTGLMILVVAAVFLIAFVGLALTALFLGLLETGMHPALDALLTGFVALFISGILAWVGLQTAKD